MCRIAISYVSDSRGVPRACDERSGQRSDLSRPDQRTRYLIEKNILNQFHAVSRTQQDRGKLVLRHLVPHFLPNCELNHFASTPERRNGNINLYKSIKRWRGRRGAGAQGCDCNATDVGLIPTHEGVNYYLLIFSFFCSDIKTKARH